jgi:alpha-glucosidase
MELCTRWMQLSAWFPFYRNHNSRNTIAQEAYRWATTAESTRRIMNIRYSILPYTYTLFHKANVAGETVLRALAWEFPDDPQLKAVETQFMSGPALLVTPVLAPLATTVQGVFPGVAQGQIWYDWYSLEKINAAPGENVTLQAPLVHQPIHIRGGYIVPIQKAGNTTKTSRQSPWSLIVALDKNGEAEGELYLDDGISLVPNATKNVEVSRSHPERVMFLLIMAAALLRKQYPQDYRVRELQRRHPARQYHHRRYPVEASVRFGQR